MLNLFSIPVLLELEQHLLLFPTSLLPTRTQLVLRTTQTRINLTAETDVPRRNFNPPLRPNWKHVPQKILLAASLFRSSLSLAEFARTLRSAFRLTIAGGDGCGTGQCEGGFICVKWSVRPRERWIPELHVPGLNSQPTWIRLLGLPGEASADPGMELSPLVRR